MSSRSVKQSDTCMTGEMVYTFFGSQAIHVAIVYQFGNRYKGHQGYNLPPA